MYTHKCFFALWESPALRGSLLIGLLGPYRDLMNHMGYLGSNLGWLLQGKSLKGYVLLVLYSSPLTYLLLLTYLNSMHFHAFVRFNRRNTHTDVFDLVTFSLTCPTELLLCKQRR